MLALHSCVNNVLGVALSMNTTMSCQPWPLKSLALSLSAWQCGILTKCVAWNGTDPAPERLTTSVSLRTASKCADGVALFQLCQTQPDLKELSISAAAFESPMPGQWNLRQLEKLHVEFNQLSDPDKAFEGILQHADHLYLKELMLKCKGAGFARLPASSLAKLHVENLQLEGFTLHQSAKLATKKGRLVDCLLDISWLDCILFYEGAPQLQLDRCRLQQGLAWRIWCLHAPC